MNEARKASSAPEAWIPKALLVYHVREWHGHVRDVTPVPQLRKWTKAELENTHAELHRMMEQGP